jgi:hypothetical protein
MFVVSSTSCPAEGSVEVTDPTGKVKSARASWRDGSREIGGADRSTGLIGSRAVDSESILTIVPRIEVESGERVLLIRRWFRLA